MGAQTRSGNGVVMEMVLPPRYRARRLIAHGGMASVWCAEDTTLDRKVAIKVLAERHAHDQEFVRRFAREARAAARLSSHPNIVTIFDVGETGDGDAQRGFIVMEYLSGGTVADALRVGDVNQDRALAWLRQAAEALDYAHQHGIVHRDVKPGNLLLDRERRLHVADFGIAWVAAEDTLTQTGQLLGTAAYLSPEQALGEPASEAGDRYALAVVAFELLVGRRPFAAEHFAGQARQHIEQDPPRASSLRHGLPEELDAVLARGLAKHPADRWTSAGAFVDALARALRGQSPASRTAATRRMAVAASPTRRTVVAAPPARRRRFPRVAAIAALAAAAVVVGAAANALTSGGSTPPTRPAKAAAHAATRVVHRVTPPPSRAASTSTTTSSTSTTRAKPPPPQPNAAALEARGHQLMAQGDYPAAIEVLHQALSAATPSSPTFAYALFDLGRSLRLAGDPAQAAVVLQRRLQIPNQTEAVRQELQLALQAIGIRLHGHHGHGHAFGHGR
jgi:serine/threonine-protein kinase